MQSRLRKRLAGMLGMLLLGGCLSPVREEADFAVCEKAAHAIDLQPLTQADESTRMPPAQAKDSGDASPLTRASYQQPRPGEAQRSQTSTLLERLKLPPEIPGANVPPIRLPATEVPAERNAAIDRLYPQLPPLGPNVELPPGPSGLPLTLADLQQLAMSNSPLLRQAAADVEAAKGALIQAGAYPNPNFGYQADTAGTGGTAGYQGFFIEQMIKTAGKLKLAQAMATMELVNSQLAFRRAQTDLIAQVRAGYFAVLVAQENIRVARALARFTDETFRIQVELVKASPAAAYEPMQLRVLAFQARTVLLQARNRHTSAWKQLTATLGLPALPPTALAGRVDVPLPVFHWDTALARVLSRHTDVLTAEATLQRARYNLRQAQVTPVPDVSLHLAVQKDYTTPPFTIVSSVQLGVPLPVWDQNRGNIRQAQGQLLRAVEEGHRVRDDLTSRLAEAFERYEDNRKILQVYRDQILPDQVRVYRGVVVRHNALGEGEPAAVTFGDVVTAQQTLATAVTTYLTTLGAQWTAVVDVANLLQTNDLFEMGGADDADCGTPMADLEHLLELPCCHPCSSLKDPVLKGANGSWPEAPAVEEKPIAPVKQEPERKEQGQEAGASREPRLLRIIVPVNNSLPTQPNSLGTPAQPVRIISNRG